MHLFPGVTIGNILALGTGGVLCSSDIFGGWPSVFYIPGIITVAWTVCWFLLVFDSPDEHPRITREEKEYLKSVAHVDVKTVKVTMAFSI